MPGIASAATAVVIGHVAGGTSTIRVGAGGIMLPNHAPLVIAEQFGTLESLYPGPHRSRPGPRAGHRPARPRARCAAILAATDEHFPQDVLELQRYFAARRSRARRVRAIPGAGLRRADLAARLQRSSAPSWPRRSACRSRSRRTSPRLPAAGRSTSTGAASDPRRQLERPYVMVGVNVFAADTDAEAQRLFTSLQQQS